MPFISWRKGPSLCVLFFLLDLSDRQPSLDLDFSDEFTDRGILQSCTAESVCHLRKLLERKTHSSEVSSLFINQGFLTVFLCLYLPKFSFVVLALAFLPSIAWLSSTSANGNTGPTKRLYLWDAFTHSNQSVWKKQLKQAVDLILLIPVLWCWRQAEL